MQEGWNADLLLICGQASSAAEKCYLQQRAQDAEGGSIFSPSNAKSDGSRCMLNVVFAHDLLAMGGAHARPTLVDELSGNGTLVYGMGSKAWAEFCAGHWLFCKRIVSAAFSHVADKYPNDGIEYYKWDDGDLSQDVIKGNHMRFRIRYIREAPKAGGSWF